MSRSGERERTRGVQARDGNQPAVAPRLLRASAVRRRFYVTALIAVNAAVAVILLVASPRGLFTGDEGVKLAEIQGLAFSAYRDASLYDPGATVTADRTLDAFAASEHFTFSGDDPAKIYGTYPLVYPALAVPLYLLGGVRGAALLSLAGFVAVLLLTARLARRCLLPEPAVAAAVAIVGLASAMPLYATTLFEHTASVAVLLAAIDTVVAGTPTARRMLLAGALFAAATCLRTELYAFAPSMALIAAWRIGVRRPAWPRWFAFGAGALAVLAAFLVCHRLATPAWHPTLTVSADGAVPSFHERLGHVLAYRLVYPWWILVVATLGIGIVRSLRGRPSPAVTAVVALAWCIAAALAIRGVAAAGDVRTLTGLLTATPVLVLALVDGVPRDGTPRGVLVIAAAVFGAIVVLLPKGSACGGLELGARYLLPVVPLLAIAASAAACRHRFDRICWAVLFAASVWATAVNARAQWRIRELGENVLAAIDRSNAQAMFTSVWWVAQLAVPAQADGVSLYVGDAPSSVYDQLHARGARRVVSLRGAPPYPTGHIRLRRLPETLVADPRLAPQLYELTGAIAGSLH